MYFSTLSIGNICSVGTDYCPVTVIHINTHHLNKYCVGGEIYMHERTNVRVTQMYGGIYQFSWYISLMITCVGVALFSTTQRNLSVIPIGPVTRCDEIVQETRAQIWPNLAPEYICRLMIDYLSPNSSLFKSSGNLYYLQLILFAFEKKK